MTTLRPLETDLTRFYALFPQPALARDLFNIVESHRVDARIRRAYPGIRRDMAIDPRGHARAPARPGRPARRPGRGRGSCSSTPSGPRATLGADLAAGACARWPPPSRQTMDAVPAEDAQVADSARVAAEPLRADRRGRADPNRWAGERAEPDTAAAGGRRATPARAPRPPRCSSGPGSEDYQSLELPPFMTPVIEEMVRQQREARPRAHRRALGRARARARRTTPSPTTSRP